MVIFVCTVSWTGSELLLNEFRRANWVQIQKDLEFSGILTTSYVWALQNQ